MEGGYVSPSLLIVSRMVANVADRGIYLAQHTATLRSLVSLLRQAANDGERRSLQYKRVRLHGLLQRMKPGDVLLYRGGWTAPGNDTSRTQQHTVAKECRLPVTDDAICVKQMVAMQSCCTLNDTRTPSRLSHSTLGKAYETIPAVTHTTPKSSAKLHSGNTQWRHHKHSSIATRPPTSPTPLLQSR